MKDRTSIICWVIFLVIIAGCIVTINSQYRRLSAEINIAMANSVSATLTATNAINFLMKRTDSGKSITVNNCNASLSMASGFALPAGYSIQSGAVAPNQLTACNLIGPDDTVAKFYEIGVQ